MREFAVKREGTEERLGGVGRSGEVLRKYWVVGSERWPPLCCDQ